MESPQARFPQGKMVARDEEEEEENGNVCDQTHGYLPHDHAHPHSWSAQTHHLRHQKEECWKGRRMIVDLGRLWWVGVGEKWETGEIVGVTP